MGVGMSRAGLRVLVCGGRGYNDRARAYAELDRLVPERSTIIVGGANGADNLARDWFFERIDRLSIIDHYPAEWRKHGRAAGPIRNQRMLDESKPDLVVASPGDSGTADMVARARKAGVSAEAPSAA